MNYKSSVLREKENMSVVNVSPGENVSKYLPISFLTPTPRESQPAVENAVKSLHCLDLDYLYADLVMNTAGFVDFNTTATKFAAMMTSNIIEQEIIIPQDEENLSDEDWDYVQTFS